MLVRHVIICVFFKPQPAYVRLKREWSADVCSSDLVNTPAVAFAEVPFGGMKQTGYGREGGSMAIKDYLNIKYTHFGISY